MNKHGGYRGKDCKMLDFSININPFGMPKEMKHLLTETLEKVSVYPEIDGESARRKIAFDIGIKRDNLILGNGAIELIYLFARSHQIKKALIITPTFNEYQRALEMNGCQVIDTFLLKPENHFTIDESVFCQTVLDKKPEVIYLCNPTNPTGQYYSKAQIKGLMSQCPREIIWFIDESFIEFSENESCLSMIDDENRQLFILRSMTKSFGIPGIRIGYGAGSIEIIKRMESHKEPWTINALALTAASHAYDYCDFLEKTRTYIKRERERVYEQLNAIEGIHPFKSAADFHLIYTEMPAQMLNERLNAQSVNVRTCEDFRGLETHYIRASIKMPDENDRLLACLKEYMRR